MAENVFAVLALVAVAAGIAGAVVVFTRIRGLGRVGRAIQDYFRLS